MTIHSSLKTKSGALSQHRNVLKRAERISKLSSQEKFDPAKQSPLGIVKVRNVNTAAKKGKTEKAAEGGDAKAAAPAAGAKGAAKPAAGAKAAAPAAGAKAAAPAAGAKKK